MLGSEKRVFLSTFPAPRERMVVSNLSVISDIDLFSPQERMLLAEAGYGPDLSDRGGMRLISGYRICITRPDENSP